MITLKPLLMKKIIALLFIALCLTGCISQKKCAKRFPPVASADTIIKDSIVERQTVVPIYVASDSGYLKAWIECINSKPVITQIVDNSPGTHVRPAVTLDGNVLTAKCKVDSFAVFTIYREKEVYKSLRTQSVVVKITNILTGWQWFQLWSGRIALIIIVLYVGIKYIWPLIRKAIIKV